MASSRGPIQRHSLPDLTSAPFLEFIPATVFSPQSWNRYEASLGISVQIGVNPWLVSYCTSKLTTAPANTFCPAAGTCDTMMLAGVACAGASTAGTAGPVGAPGMPGLVTSPTEGLAGDTTLTFPS